MKIVLLFERSDSVLCSVCKECEQSLYLWLVCVWTTDTSLSIGFFFLPAIESYTYIIMYAYKKYTCAYTYTLFS